MKKLSLALALLLFITLFGVLAEETSAGIWKLAYYEDEFRMPTDEPYICNAEPIEGIFSNSAVTDEKLGVTIMVDENNLAFMLYEYGDRQVRNTSSQRCSYDVILRDAAGNKTYMLGWMPTGSNRILVSPVDKKIISDAIKHSTTVSFYIAEENNPFINYLFTIDDTTGFSEMTTVLNNLYYERNHQGTEGLLEEQGTQFETGIDSNTEVSGGFIVDSEMFIESESAPTLVPSLTEGEDEAAASNAPAEPAYEGPQVVKVVPFGESYTYTTQVKLDGTARLEADAEPYETLKFTQTMKEYLRPSDFADRYSTEYRLQGDEAGAGFELVLNDYVGTSIIIPQRVIDVQFCSATGNTIERGYQLMDKAICGNYDVIVESGIPNILYKRYSYSDEGERMAYLVVTTYNDGIQQIILFELER